MAGILDQQDQPGTDLDPTKNYYEDLVGDGKTFKDNESLAKGKYMADMHIKMLERRMDELREDYIKAQEASKATTRLEDLIKTLETKQTVSSEQPPAKESPPSFDLNELDTLMSKKLEQGLSAYEVANRQKENTRVVVDKLKERYGDNYQTYVKSQIQSLGMSEDMFNQMVQNSPQAVLRTLGITDQTRESFQAPPRSGQQFQFRGEPKRTWSYYQKLKKDNPRLYHDPKTLIRMEQDAVALGQEFEDGDFSRI